MPINEYDDILSKGKVASSGNEYLDLLGGQKDIQKQQLQTSFYKAKDKLPDRSADIQKLSKRSNLPEDFVERNYDEIKKQSESKTDYSSLINNSPATATYMSNPYNAATSKDDVEPLSKMEKSVRLMRNRNPIARTGSEVKQSAMTGWNDLNASTWHLAMAYGLTDIDTASIQIAESNKRSQELRSRVPDYAKDFNDVMSKQGQDVDRAFSLFSEGYDAQKNGQIGQALKDYSSGTIKTVGEVLDMVGSAVVRPRGLAYSTIQNLAHSLPSLITGFSGAKAGGFAGAKIGAGVALIAGQAGPQAASPEELVTVPTFSAVGGSLGGIGGFVSGSFAGQVPVEVGAWINEQLSGKGYDLTDPEQIKQAYSDTELIADIKAEAERKGITTAAVDSIFNMFAGKLVSGAKGTRLSTTLRTAGDIGVQSVGEGTSEFAGQVAAKKGLEGTSLGEAVQEGITSLGHSFGETAIGASTRGVDIKGKGKEVAQETIKKARDLFSKNPIKAAQEVSKEAGNAVKAQQDAQALSDIAEAVKESKTAQRNPEAIKEIIDIATQGDDDSNVYFQTQDWDDYWISKGESPSQKAAEIMGDGGKSYFEAKNNGDNFSLPLSDYVSKLASTDDFNGLLPSARTDLEGMSLQEAKDFLKGLPEVMDTLAEEATQQEQEIQDTSEQVATNITEQLVNAGFEQSTAETYGQLYKSTFSTLAQRTGKSVDELFGRFNLKIQRKDQFADISKKVSISTGLEDITNKQIQKKRMDELKREIEESSPIIKFKKSVGKRPVFVPEENWNDWKPVIDKIGRQYFTKNKIKGSGITIDTFAQEFGSQLIGNELSEQELFELLDNAGNMTQESIKKEVENRINEENEYIKYLRSEEVKDLYEGITIDQIDELLSSKNELETHVKAMNNLEPDLNLTSEEVTNELNKLRQIINQTDQASQSEGQFFQTSPEVNTPEFKKWFGDSKVVNESGDPLVVYHGTTKSFDFFDISLSHAGVAGWFSDSNYTASVHTKELQSKRKESIYGEKFKTGGQVYPVFLSIKNPKIVTKEDFRKYSDRDVAEMAKYEGYDGLILNDVNGSNIYVAFESSQIKSVNNRGTFDPEDPRILFQTAQGIGDKLLNMFQKETRVKGSFQFGNEKFNINLFKNADLSTFLHESGHFYLEMMGDLIDSGLSNDDQIKSDYESILKWLGVESRNQIKTEHHEKFARGFETYLMEGKAPSSALREAFAKFRAWLTSIYRSIRNLNAPISKEIRGVFDRLIATDEEIAVAQEEANITQIFTSAEQAGMTDEEFKLYEETVREASQMAQDSLQQKILKQYRREQEKWWKDRTEEVRQQVTEEVNNDKNYIALSVLQRGTLPDGSPLPEGIEAIKISKKALTNTYDKSILKKLPKPYIYTQSDDGVHQDVAAEMLGYSSGDDLVNTLSGLPNKKQAIDTMTDARMRDQYGDKLIDGSLAEDARIAVNNDKRAKVILAELKALRKKQRDVKPFIDAQKNMQKEGVSTLKSAIPTIDVVRRIAKNTIAGKKVRNVKPYNYFVAARKSSKQAFEALSKNNYDDAAKFKQQELLSMELYREATRVQDEVDKTVNFMKRFAKKSTREKIAKAGSDYLDQIDSLLDRFDFAKGISLKSIDRRKSLLEWVQSQEEQGLVADIPEKLLDEAYKIHYKDLKIDELTGLKDSVKNIEHFARMKNRLLKAAKQRAFDEVIDEAVASVEANSKGKRKVDIETRLPQEETKRRIEGYFAEHRKFASLVFQMDGFEDGGTLWEILTRPMNEAGDKEAVMREQATEKLKEIFSAYTTKELTQLYKKEFVPEINDSLTKMARLSVALNWGNADSKQKVMDGRNWSQGQVEAILDMLDERDWNFVQNVWDFVDSYWAESKALAERVNGVAPGKVEAEPVQTKYGQFRGGYYPLKYDDILSDRAYENAAKEAAEKAMSGAFIRSTTKHGHRKQRVEGVKMPIRLDFGVLFEHVTEIIHDQTHYEFLIDTNKILKDERMKTAIKENYGDIVYRELTKTVNDVAAGIVPAQNSFEKAINWLRSGTSISAMGWNLMTSLQQPLGLTQSMVRIGPKWVAKGISRWIGSPQKMQTTINDIYSKSDMMRLRGKTQMREINEIRNKLRIRGKLSAIEDSYFYLIAKGQMIADIPTWLGAYEKAWGTDTEMTEEKAARLADQAVLDSQGGGQVKDLADIQRGGPLKKLWTNFYSYFNTTYNLTAESFKKHDIKSASGIGALAVDLLMLYTLPAVLGVLLKDAIKGGDDEPLPEKLIREQAGYVLGTMVGVRELGSVVQGFYGYEGPAGTRFFGEFGGLIKQIEQGEADAAFWKSLNQTGGILFHYPAGQIDRTFRGLNQMGRNKTSNPLVLVTGPKRQ